MPLITVHRDGEELIFWFSIQHIGGHITKPKQGYQELFLFFEFSVLLYLLVKTQKDT
jgi:hypothetical protein